ncbi:HLH-14 protein [Aphelenchoides avenae]|nr:HLH-14 protein [Aphelenchus avenae]
MSHHEYYSVNATPSSSADDALHFVKAGTVTKHRSGRTIKSTVLGKTPTQVQRRNERERRRVQQVNNGYEVLRLQVSPWEKVKNKKLTKSETLKAAIDYIEHLQSLLGEGGSRRAYSSDGCSPASIEARTYSPAPSATAVRSSSLSANSSSSTMSPSYDSMPPFAYPGYSPQQPYHFVLPDPHYMPLNYVYDSPSR